jgi:transposase InsO family protein
MGTGFCRANFSHVKKEEVHLGVYRFCDQVGEEKSLYQATEKSVIEFMYEDIFTRFSVPREIVTDQGAQFTSKLMKELIDKYGIKHCKSSPYHPQANGKVESTDKVLEAILTKTIHLHHKDWADRLPEDLWAYRTTWRNTTGHTPYELVFGKKILLPIEF